ncbi:hypothetical protein [Actinomadura yumaensis]|uniref:Uncharacterized protein n=1 Tax=Actinomadura yumaensis TaxID=111807 RepID=A0ABW2D205_9ACTN
MLWWPDTASGGPAEITIRPRPGPGPHRIRRTFSSSLLRSVPLARTTAEVRRLQRSARECREGFTESRRAVDGLVRYLREALEADPRPGRRGRPDAFFAAAAAVYAWYVELQHRNPVEQLAGACSSSWTASANWVRTARDKGFLTAVSDEHPHGELTAGALDLLAAVEPLDP